MKKLLITLFLSISCLFSFSQLAPLVQQAKNFLDSNIVSNTTRQITPTKLHTSIDKVIAALNYIDTSDLFKKDTILQVYPFTINIVDNIKYLSIDTSAGKWRSENYYDTKYLQAGSIGVPTDITYADLTSAITAKTLNFGSFYRLTDFRTVYKVYGQADTTSGEIEPLILQASSDSTLSGSVFSPKYPNDDIYYSVTDASPLAPAAGSKGVIIFRKDKVNNLSAHYDWRTVKWRRWALTAGTYYFAFTSGTPAISTDSLDVLTFASGNTDCSIGSNSWNIILGTNNSSVHIGSEVGGPGTGVDIGNSNHGITIDSKCANVQTTGSGYIGGIWIGNSCTYINIGKRSYNIAIGSSCYAIDLGMQNNDVSIPPSTLRGRLEKGYSNFQATVALSGKTIDLYNTNIYALPSFLYNSAHYAGIVNVTSANAVDTIDVISAQSTSIHYSDIEIRPEAGLKLLIRDKGSATTSGANFRNSGNSVLIDGDSLQYASVHKNILNTLGSQTGDFLLTGTNKTAVPGGGSTSARYVMSLTAPTDTTVGWIDLRYNFYDAFPVHNWVNGAWSHTDTTGGQFWDNVGMVFSRGRPYIIIATGQSNLGGSYIGEASNPNASPYNGYYGDTIPCRAVVAWDYNRNIWVVAKIRDTPFQYSSGANYLLIAAKKINEQTGRSVRIVTYPVGGTGLQCWLPDSTCYNEFKSMVQNSGIIHPDLFVWSQSEAGITPAPTFDTYFNRWLGMKDTMILDGLMDTTTLKILMASGDTLTNGNVIQMLNGTSAGEGALRALAATNDPTIKYVPLFKYQIQLTDGLHLLPKGHEITGEALFYSAMEGPKVAGRDMMGYGAPSPYKWSSNEQRLGLGGLVAINSGNKSYFGLGVEGNDTYYTAAEPNLSGQYASGLRFSQALNTARLSHYNNTSWLQLEDARGLFNMPTATKQSVMAYSGGDPEFILNDTDLGKEWKLQMANTTNELHFTYDGTRRFHFTKTGEFGAGLTGAEVPDSMVRIKGGLWGEGGVRFSGLPSNQTYSKSLAITSNGTVYTKDTVAHSVTTLTGLGTGVATSLAANTNATGGVLTGGSSVSVNVLTILSDVRPTKTITAAGTTGAQTINKTTGTVNFAAGATTLVVTNSFASTSSVIMVTVYGTDATATSARVTKAVGSFTITLNAAATAETAVGFVVTN